MKAVILAGGYGTRLYPLTMRTPKPLLPLAGKPIVEHLIESLAASGVNDLVVSIKQDQMRIAEKLGDGSALGCKISYAVEPAASEDNKLGSVGALEYVFSRMGDPVECFVVGADNYFHGLDYRKLKEFHSSKSAHATIALYHLPDPAQAMHYGVAAVDAHGRITKFQEKPQPGKAASALASTAAYYLDDDFLCRHIPDYCGSARRQGKSADRIGDLWEHYLDSLHLYGYAFRGYWGDIGNAENYLQTDAAALGFSKSRIISHVPSGTVKGNGVRIGNGVKIHATAVVRGPAFIGDGVHIGKGAAVGPAVSAYNSAHIGEGAKISHSILLEHSKIGKHAAVHNTVIDGHAEIGEGANVDGSTIGFRCAVGAGSHLKNCRLFPFQHAKAHSHLAGQDIGIGAGLSALQKKELGESCYWL
ncbi:MAG: NDP-sugar synthase [Candidatus Micrarchaeota archaeon]